MNWLETLKAEVAAANGARGKGGIAAVARALGVSRTALSLALAGKYPGGTGRLAARVLAEFGKGRVMCPHLAEEIRIPDCARWRRRAMPTSDPGALKHWAACRKCPVGAALEQGVQPPGPKEAAHAV